MRLHSARSLPSSTFFPSPFMPATRVEKYFGTMSERRLSGDERRGSMMTQSSSAALTSFILKAEP